MARRWASLAAALAAASTRSAQASDFSAMAYGILLVSSAVALPASVVVVVILRRLWSRRRRWWFWLLLWWALFLVFLFVAWAIQVK